MSNYPYGYPDRRLIVGNVDLTTEFQIVLVDDFVLQPPEPKFYKIDIPGGNGEIDLTEALGGDVAFKNRKQQFVFKAIYPNDFETMKTKISNFLHGRFFEYRLSWDVGYTYKGRFSVTSYSHIALAAGILGDIVIEVDADPYKYLEKQVYAINGAGGEKYYFPSGRKPVRPVVQTNRPTSIVWKGKTIRVGIGTFRLNDVLFTEGINEIYFNTYQIFVTKWEDISEGGDYEMTWNEAKEYTWDEIGRLVVDVVGPSTEPKMLAAIETETPSGEYFAKAYRWADLYAGGLTWGYLYEHKWTWDGMNRNPGDVDFDGAAMYMTYEWGDL